MRIWNDSEKKSFLLIFQGLWRSPKLVAESSPSELANEFSRLS